MVLGQVQEFDTSFAGAAKANKLTLEFGVTLKLEGNIVQMIKACADADMKLWHPSPNEAIRASGV